MNAIFFTEPCTESETQSPNSGHAARPSHEAQPGDRHEGLRNVAHAPSPGNPSGGASGVLKSFIPWTPVRPLAWQPQSGTDSSSNEARDGEDPANSDDVSRRRCDTLTDNEDSHDDDDEQTSESSSSVELVGVATSSTCGSKRAPPPDAILSVRPSPAKIHCFHSNFHSHKKLGQPEDDMSESSQSSQSRSSEGPESSEDESDFEDTADMRVPPAARSARPTPVEAPFTSLKEFNIALELGSGAYGKVYLVQDIRNDSGCPNQVFPLFALKAVSKESEDGEGNKCRSFFDTEVELLKKAKKSPSAVAFHSSFETEKAWYIVLEYCHGGTLHAKCHGDEKLEPNMARIYIAQLVLAIDSLHALDIVHYDLKPANVLLGYKGEVRIADFGLAASDVKHYTSGGVCPGGTQGYIAPEVLKEDAHGKAVDWYALGVIALELLTGRGFRDGKFKSLLKCLRQERRLSLSMHKYLSCDAIGLLKGLLNEDPRRRLGSYGVGDIKKHKFFRGVDWEVVASNAVSLEEMARNYDPKEVPEEDEALPEDINEPDAGDDADTTDMDYDSDSDTDSVIDDE
jgi:serine/threonine protein kinase